uniref:DUF3456 domain-containing protein n=1 Tax=Anas zonorhyncha TaxID=75864 RepID=A0A8B9ZX27_9AVES
MGETGQEGVGQHSSIWDLLSAQHGCCFPSVTPTGACRALVDELEWEIAQVDPRKTIQMGSFRINPDGSQSVPYARSEAHLTELLERVCEKMKEYGEKVDPSTHRKSYVRVISHDGTKMDLSGVKIDGDVASSLKFACESIAEEYEDELIEFLSHEADNVKDRLCSKRTGELGWAVLGLGLSGCQSILQGAQSPLQDPLSLGRFQVCPSPSSMLGAFCSSQASAGFFWSKALEAEGFPHGSDSPSSRRCPVSSGHAASP